MYGKKYRDGVDWLIELCLRILVKAHTKFRLVKPDDYSIGYLHGVS